MTYILIVDNRGAIGALEQARKVEEKVGPRQDIEGLLVEAVSSDANGLHHVYLWESKAHRDRYEAEKLLPVFQAMGMTQEVTQDVHFTEYEADHVFIR